MVFLRRIYPVRIHNPMNEEFLTWLQHHDQRDAVLRKARTFLAIRTIPLPHPNEMTPLASPNTLVLHSTGLDAADAGRIRAYHQIINGWADCGYHFLVANENHPRLPAGSIECGRDIRFQGAHARGHNSNSIGIAHIGPQRPQCDSLLLGLETLVVALARKYAIPPERIIGHSELDPHKADPHPSVLKHIRNRLATRLAKSSWEARHTWDARRWLRQSPATTERDWTKRLDQARLMGAHRIALPAQWDTDLSATRAKLASLAAIAHREGFFLFAYTGPFGTETQRTLNRLPHLREWLQIDGNGAPASYGGLPMFCPNSPYLPEYRNPIIGELLGEIPFDGVFLDIPWFMRGACHCRFCRDSPLPPSLAIRNAVARSVVTWRNAHPSIEIAANIGSPGTPQHPAWCGVEADTFNGIADELVTELTPALTPEAPVVIRDLVARVATANPGIRISHAFQPHKPGASRLPTILSEAGCGLWHSRVDAWRPSA